MGAEKKALSLAEVSVHNKAEDCWVIINAKAYNVTNFLVDHPGGDEVLFAAAGKDASEEFEDAGHGSAARLMLDEFYVGETDKSTTSYSPPTPMKQLLTQEIDDKSSNKFMFIIKVLQFLVIPLSILALASGFHFYN